MSAKSSVSAYNMIGTYSSMPSSFQSSMGVLTLKNEGTYSNAPSDRCLKLRYMQRTAMQKYIQLEIAAA